MLEKLTPVKGDAANSIRITCELCGAKETYGKAVALGWTFDPKGRAFKAYQCNAHPGPTR